MSYPGPAADPSPIGFGDFEFCAELMQLRRSGAVIRLQHQPARVLTALLRDPGNVVSRTELRSQVWGEGVHIEFDDALNHNVRYLRGVLGDDPAYPRFIQTVPKLGYRFIAPVHRLEAMPLAPPLNLRVPESGRRPARAEVALALTCLVGAIVIGRGALSFLNVLQRPSTRLRQ